MSQPFQHKEHYEGNIDEKNRNKNYSQFGNDSFVIKKRTKNKSIKKIMNARKILMRLIQQMNLK